jgi:hypothetical protein
MNGIVSDQALVVWSALGTVLGTLLILAATLWASRALVEQARAVWRVARGERAALVAVLDEPGDPLIARLEAITGLRAAVWAALLPAFLNALADGLDRALADESLEPGTNGPETA